MFDCTEEDGSDPLGLQEFITTEAMNYQTERLGVTYVAFREADPVAFVTVSMTSLRIVELEPPEKVSKVERRKDARTYHEIPYPALLLGRLAVEKNLRDNDIGTFLCLWVVGMARELSTRVGCRYVALHTLPLKVPFYVRDPLNFVLSSFARTDGKRLLYRRIVD